MKILAVGAHYDDIEMGAGGLLYKMIQSGHDMQYLALSDCDNSRLHKEVQFSTAVLGITDLQLYNFKRRIFSYHRQEILDVLIKHRDKFCPDLVITHGSLDIHQDHEVVYHESLRAFKKQSILGYSFPWNQYFNYSNPLIIQIDLDKKLQALSKYESQAGRESFNPDFIRDIYRNGESFEMIKMDKEIMEQL